MSKENKRREFIKNSLYTVVGAGILGKTVSAMVPDDKQTDNPILNVKPLGFQWETQEDRKSVV